MLFCFELLIQRNWFNFVEFRQLQSTNSSVTKATVSCATSCSLLQDGFGRWVSGLWRPYIPGESSSLLPNTLYLGNMHMQHVSKEKVFILFDSMFDARGPFRSIQVFRSVVMIKRIVDSGNYRTECKLILSNWTYLQQLLTELISVKIFNL